MKRTAPPPTAVPALVALLLGAAACGGGTNLEANRPDRGADTPSDADPGAPRFVVAVCRGAGGIPGYEYADLEAGAGDCSAESAYARITDADVTRYTAAAIPDGRVEVELTAEASAALRARAGERDVGWAFGEDPFEVSLDGERLYLGLNYFVGGAAALRFPVLHLVDEGGAVHLRIGAYQGIWAGWGGGGSPGDHRMDPPSLRAFFDASGRLVER